MKKILKVPYLFFIAAVLLFTVSFQKIVNVNSQVKDYETKIIPNTYINDYNISHLSIGELNNKLEEIEKEVVDKEITIALTNKVKTFKLNEIGIEINKRELYNEIVNYVNEIDYWTLYNNIDKDKFEKKTFAYKYIVNDEKLLTFLKNLKATTDTSPQKGRLSMGSDRQLKYVDEVAGYYLEIENSFTEIKNAFEKGEYVNLIELKETASYEEDTLKTINTKISSFSTTYDNTIGRKYNLMAGAKYIDGVIVYPGQVFSFFENAGPYTKEGYVYYLGMKGNGVCQVATTLYNAELLAGLKTVTRYNHGVKSVYVDGGLDATVAVTSGFVTDFKFQNVLDYPIYISAFTNEGTLTVEIWSNDKALGGKTYKTESIRHGYGSYEALRHVYQDGNYVSTENLGRSYYFSE